MSDKAPEFLTLINESNQSKRLNFFVDDLMKDNTEMSIKPLIYGSLGAFAVSATILTLAIIKNY